MHTYKHAYMHACLHAYMHTCTPLSAATQAPALLCTIERLFQLALSDAQLRLSAAVLPPALEISPYAPPDINAFAMKSWSFGLDLRQVSAKMSFAKECSALSRLPGRRPAQRGLQPHGAPAVERIKLMLSFHALGLQALPG